MSHTPHTSKSVFAALRKGVTVAPVTAEEEATLIRYAQGGDETALYDLIALYAPAARNALARSAYSRVAPEDAEMEVMLAFMDVIKSHDPERSPRIAGRISARMGQFLGEAVSESGTFAIPGRTMRRFVGIVQKADGDYAEAARIAPENGMSTEVFLAVMAADRAGTLDGGSEDAPARIDGARVLGTEGNDDYAALEDHLLVEFAMTTLDERETAVTRTAYGFDAAEVDGTTLYPEGSAPLSDTLVGASLGLGRATTQRARTSALTKMRAALALDTNEEN